ncbi:uncharacterized protein BDV17DRAFT_252238 [Aspergillus undulatus]|uniref:uncharacterized protein n=1 Tax=Aspergillus undulatus TaxID=1810928 RepID=UPI003CCD365D
MSVPGTERHHTPGQPAYQPFMPVEQENIRSRLREERHAALCVLMDRELLTIQALAAQETLPQTRRRFLSTLLSPSDPTTAAAIRADQFTIQRPRPLTHLTPLSSHTELVTVPRGVVDICETGDSGWYKPIPSASTGAEDTLGGMGSPSASASPVSSAKMKRLTAGTPERTRAGRRDSSGRHQLQQNRERRRRWSGAERQDYGAGASF